MSAEPDQASRSSWRSANQRQLRVLGISGSLRRDSHNTQLLRAAAELMPPPAELVVYGHLKAVPPYDADDDGDAPPGAVRDLRAAIETADALLFATPEYNHSIPGQLKNALDWASRPAGNGALRNKPVAVTGATTGVFGAVWAQAELRKVLGATGARVVDREVPFARAHQAFHDDGRLVDAGLEGTLAALCAELAGEAERSPVPA